jgi:hypothetical protein
MLLNALGGRRTEPTLVTLPPLLVRLAAAAAATAARAALFVDVLTLISVLAVGSKAVRSKRRQIWKKWTADIWGSLWLVQLGVVVLPTKMPVSLFAGSGACTQ